MSEIKDRQIDHLIFKSMAEVEIKIYNDETAAIAEAAKVGTIYPKLQPAEDAAYVKRICNAMLSTEELVLDKTPTGKPRQAVLKIADEELCPDIVVETAAWRILDKAKLAYTIGSTQPYHNVKADTYWNFYNHIEAIIKALKVSKDIVKRILDPDFLSKFVEQPEKSIKAIIDNSKLNTKRNQQVRAGILALATDAREDTTVGESSSSSSQVVEALFPNGGRVQ